MQAPAENLLLLGSTGATLRTATNLTTAPRPHAPTDRERNAVDDEHRTARETFSQAGRKEGQPIRQAVQPTIEARQIEPSGPVVRFTQHAQGTFMMVLEVLRNYLKLEGFLWFCKAHDL